MSQCVCFATLATVLDGPDFVDKYADLFIDAFGLSDDIKTFFKHQWLPEIRNATNNFHLPPDEYSKLERNIWSFVLKTSYALLWQVSERLK